MNREKVGTLLKVGFLKHTNRMQFCSQGKKGRRKGRAKGDLMKGKKKGWKIKSILISIEQEELILSRRREEEEILVIQPLYNRINSFCLNTQKDIRA